MFAYGIGALSLGFFADKINLKKYLAYGLFPAVAALITETILIFVNKVNVWDFSILQVINGLGQSTGHTAFIAINGNWQNKKTRGLIIGLWIGCVNIGDILGQQLGQLINGDLGLSIGYVFLIMTIMLLFMGLVCMISLQPYPEKFGLEGIINNKVDYALINDTQIDEQGAPNEQIVIEDKIKANSVVSDFENNNKKFEEEKIDTIPQEIDIISAQLPQEKQAKVHRYIIKYGVNLLTAWLLPNVAFYALCFGALKSADYGTLFWLTDFLKKNGIASNSATNIVSMFDIGIYFGGILLGLLSDRFLERRRVILMVPFCILCSIPLILLIKIPLLTVYDYGVLSFFYGFLLGGPYQVLNGSIGIDLSRQPAFAIYINTVGTITSLIDGTGSLIGGIFQQLIPIIGEEHIFDIFFALILVAAVILSYPFVISCMQFHKNRSILKQ